MSLLLHFGVERNAELQIPPALGARKPVGSDSCQRKKVRRDSEKRRESVEKGVKKDRKLC